MEMPPNTFKNSTGEVSELALSVVSMVPWASGRWEPQPVDRLGPPVRLCRSISTLHSKRRDTNVRSRVEENQLPKEPACAPTLKFSIQDHKILSGTEAERFIYTFNPHISRITLQDQEQFCESSELERGHKQALPQALPHHSELRRSENLYRTYT